MINNCLICGANIIAEKEHLYSCQKCGIIFSDKIYEYNKDFFADFIDDDFIANRAVVFEDFFNNKKIKPLISKKLKVLDFGCATGDFIKYASERTPWKFIGMDVSPQALNIAKQKNPQSRFLNANDLAMMENSSIDIIFSSHTVEHIAQPREFILNVLRILKDGGIFYLEVPNDRTNLMLWYKNRFSRKEVYRYYANHPYGHVYFYNTKSIKKLFSHFKIKIKHKQFPLITSEKNWKLYTTELIKSFLFRVFPVFKVADRIIVIAKNIKTRRFTFKNNKFQ